MKFISEEQFKKFWSIKEKMPAHPTYAWREFSKFLEVNEGTYSKIDFLILEIQKNVQALNYVELEKNTNDLKTAIASEINDLFFEESNERMVCDE